MRFQQESDLRAQSELRVKELELEVGFVFLSQADRSLERSACNSDSGSERDPSPLPRAQREVPSSPNGVDEAERSVGIGLFIHV